MKDRKQRLSMIARRLMLFIILLISGCDLNEGNNEASSLSQEAKVCTPSTQNGCCVGTQDSCGSVYGQIVNVYLGYPAYSNGACTGNVSGAYQCAKLAKDFYTDQLNHVKCDDGTTACKGFSQQWTPWIENLQAYRNVALDAEDSNYNEADPLFVFKHENSGWNSTEELPRETDILVFESGGTGHFVIAKEPEKVSDDEYNIPIIEHNVAMTDRNGPGGDCHNRVLVAKKQNGKWSIPSGIGSSYVYAGFIRHNLAGIYSDNGWHDDGKSEAFREAYKYADEHSDNKKIGWAFNNGGGPFVHRVHRVSLQDFIYTDTDHLYGTDGQSAIILAPNNREAFLVKEGFWGAYKCLPGPRSNEDATLVSGNVGGAYWLGSATNNEHQSNGTVFQDFECGFMYVEGSIIKVHLEPGWSDNCPEPQLNTYELVSRSREACPNLEIESNWPVGALCPSTQEVCDGKDNNSDGVADEGCGDAPQNVLRLRYSILLMIRLLPPPPKCPFCLKK